MARARASSKTENMTGEEGLEFKKNQKRHCEGKIVILTYILAFHYMSARREQL